MPTTPQPRTKCQKCGKMNARPPKRTCPTCIRAASKVRKEKARDTRAQRVYGLKPGDYEKLWAGSPFGPGTCYICGGKGAGKLNIDHSHASGEVRGLLCTLDNRHLLGMIGHDDADRLERIMLAAVDYLRNPPARKVL